MPNIKSAIKRVKTNEKKRDQNKAFKSKLTTYIKKFNKAVEANEVVEAEKLFVETTGLIDKAVGANMIHKNTAARKKSSLALKLKAINGGKAVASTKVKTAKVAKPAAAKVVKTEKAPAAAKAPAKKTTAK